jgi:hypothetical protein
MSELRPNDEVQRDLGRRTVTETETTENVIEVPNQTYLGTCQAWTFPSSSRDNLIHVVLKGDFGVRCTCEGWQYTGNCKHVNSIKLPQES